MSDVKSDKACKVLVAEDNRINQKVVLGMLKKLGYEADLVENGKAAVVAIQNNDYAMVLMDCQMPEMDGYEATRQIRKLGGTAQSIPVVALTANAMMGDREKCLNAGMDDYMAKPVRMDLLKQTLGVWTSRRSEL
ncbi:MAG: response regulator [Gammaproteobacteria bacterium]|nr:response regulator [Gammaproteobacteria bacterium]MDH5801207.1 response regulator [Gammaproteobacteria bacterium]